MLDSNPRLKMMISKLSELASAGHIENEWAETFIFDVQKRLKNGGTMTVKQIEKIEELFDKY